MASGTQADEGFDHFVVLFRDTQYDCIPWGTLYQLPKSLPAPNGTIDFSPFDLDPVTGELEFKVGDAVYFTYDPLYEEDGEYQLEEICHVTAIDSVLKNRVTFDNTLPQAGRPVCRRTRQDGSVETPGGGGFCWRLARSATFCHEACNHLKTKRFKWDCNLFAN